MKIHRIYNELNEIEDMSRDKVQIEMSASTWQLVRKVIDNARFDCTNDKELAWRISKVIDEAERNETTEWAK